MACDTPANIFRQATEDLPNEIFLKASPRDIAMNLFPREEYRSGRGLVHSTFTMGRSFPETDTPDVQLIEFTSGETFTGTCTTTYKDVPVGFDEDTYRPEKFGWRGPTICPDDLIHSHNIEDFLRLYVESMTKHTKIEIANRLWAIFDHYVPKLSIVDGETAFEDGSTGHPPDAPVLALDEAECELDQNTLDDTAQILIEEGAADGDTNGWMQQGEDGPIFPLFIGQRMSKRILLNNAELRQDYRTAFQGAGDINPVIKRLGASKVIGNFRHVITVFPPRYTYGGGAYTRVPTWVNAPGTKGEISNINPAWRAAPFEGARVLSPWVFHDQVIRPVNQVGNMNWKPRNYVGDWQFVTGGNKISATHCVDPTDKLGAHFAEYQHAAKPIHPEFGRLIIFKRCVDDHECVTCET